MPLTDDGWHYSPAYAVECHDTTGAGDCFVGALAARLARQFVPVLVDADAQAVATMIERIEAELGPIRVAVCNAGFYEERALAAGPVLLAHAIDAVRGTGKQGAVLVLDVERLRDVNMTLGRTAGDEVLIIVYPGTTMTIPEFAIVPPSQISLPTTGTVSDASGLITSGALILASTTAIASSPAAIVGSSAPALTPMYQYT